MSAPSGFHSLLRQYDRTYRSTGKASAKGALFNSKSTWSLINIKQPEEID